MLLLLNQGVGLVSEVGECVGGTRCKKSCCCEPDEQVEKLSVSILMFRLINSHPTASYRTLKLHVTLKVSEFSLR